jgi:alpha-beta hydrolase superfamily lysophospholipase
MVIEKIKNELRPIDENAADCPAVDSYLRFYGLDLANETIEHRFGTFKSGEFTLAAHIFKPKDYKAAVIIVHGYTAHCGLLNKIIKELLERKIAVCCFDLPGHGLSSGERAAICNFSQYSDCLSDFVKAIQPHIKLPCHLIGHSTGGAIAMDYLLSNREDCFHKVVLAAPLVRCADWKMAKFLFPVCRRFCQKLPRIYRKISSDKDFLKFLQYQDSLSARSFSLKWVAAMFEWNKRYAEAKQIERPILIIQGSKDNIVDWRHNLPIIMSKFRDCDVELLENARHELFNESKQYRDEVFSLIKEYLRR